MSVFAGVFGVAAIRLGLPREPFLAIIPIAVSAILLLLARKQMNRMPTPVTADSERAGTIITWASAAEGVGILVAVNVVKWLGLEGRVLPAIALVVALHFLPMAYLLPHRAFYVLAGVLLGVVIIAFCVPPALGPIVGGFGACIALWAASLLALRAARRLSTHAVRRSPR